MDNPGIVNFGDFTILSAGTQTGEWVENLDGVLSLSIQSRLAYGSGGTEVRVYIQTSFDQETTAVDIACVLFAITSETKIINLSGLTTAQITPVDGGLSDDTAVDGVLGDRFRCKIISTGTYSNSTIVSVRGMAR